MAPLVRMDVVRLDRIRFPKTRPRCGQNCSAGNTAFVAISYVPARMRLISSFRSLDASKVLEWACGQILAASANVGIRTKQPTC